jgi:hypothetical protein
MEKKLFAPHELFGEEEVEEEEEEGKFHTMLANQETKPLINANYGVR